MHTLIFTVQALRKGEGEGKESLVATVCACTDFSAILRNPDTCLYMYATLNVIGQSTVMPKVDREKSGPPGPLLAEKNGPGGPLFSAKSGPALPKVDLVHFVKKKVDLVQFWQGKKVDPVQFRCQNLSRSIFGRGKKWTRSSFAVNI